MKLGRGGGNSRLCPALHTALEQDRQFQVLVVSEVLLTEVAPVSCQVYKGPEPWFRLPATQTNCEYRARVCASRQCHDLPGCPELCGPYSPSTVFCCQRREPGPAAAPASVELGQSGKRLHEERVIAIALLCGFALVAILFAVVIQYFVIK